MKTFKLKYLKYGIAAMSFMFFMVTSCKKDETVTPVSEVSDQELAAQLEADSDFASLKVLNTDLLNEVASVLAAKGLTGDDIKRMYQEKDGEQLSQIFGDDKIESIMSQVTSVNKRLYTNYSRLVPEDAANDFELRALDGFSNLGDEFTIESRGCSWRYWACAGGAWSGLAACTIGTSGWGIFFCNVAYYSALALCTDSYC